MKAGFHTVYLEDRPIDEAARLVAAAGYEQIELNAERLPYAEPHVGPLAPAGSTERAIAAVGEAGLGVSAVGAHCEMLSMRLEDAVVFSRGCVDVARQVGAPVVHVLSGALPEGMAEPEAMERCARYAAELAEIASAAGVHLAWEAIVGMAISTSDDLERLISAVDGAIGVNFDPSHLHLTDGDAVAAARRLGPRVVHLHVKDAAGDPDSFTFPPLGQGEIDLPAVIEVLSAAGYDGTASVEWEAHAVGGFDRDDATALTGSREYLRGRLGI